MHACATTKQLTLSLSPSLAFCRQMPYKSKLRRNLAKSPIFGLAGVRPCTKSPIQGVFQQVENFATIQEPQAEVLQLSNPQNHFNAFHTHGMV